MSEEQQDVLSTTPTALPFLHRSVSRSSTWSATDTPPHHNHGTSYFTQQPPSPILVRGSSSHSQHRRPARSTSVSSSQPTNRPYREDDPLSEGDEDLPEVDPDVDGHRRPRRRGKAPASPDDDDSGEADDADDDDDPITTLKDRQSLINVQHPFGLPIWKPALYKKTRSVTRRADEALHSVPSAQAERHLLPGNLFWAIAFGWWLGLVCIIASAFLWLVPQGGDRYSNLVYGLGWYLFWPFGKYVEGDLDEDSDTKDDDESPHPRRWSDHTVRGASPSREEVRRPTASENSTVTPSTFTIRPGVSGSSPGPTETTSLLHARVEHLPVPVKSYGTNPSVYGVEIFGDSGKKGSVFGKIAFWLALITIIAPLMLIVCLICWGLVVTIPMAKLNWVLLKNLFSRPRHIRFCSAPVIVVEEEQTEDAIPEEGDGENENTTPIAQYSFKQPRLSAGQVAPAGFGSSGASKIVLCVYRAVGAQYYKYTVGGVNILFVNLLPIVFFVIFDGFVLLPILEHKEEHHEHIPAFLAIIASQGLIFFLSLLSVIPLSYFIGMAVASISAQSSIGMGAVINATFGSIIEIILYGIALTQGKGRLVEGSIVGSLLAGVLLMPGMSMCSGAFRRKELKFNAKSASVTSMMLIMAIIGALTPTLFYQTYGNFELICTGCPPSPGNDAPWKCDHCYYEHPDPAQDPFYQSTVKSLMYFCAAILVFSYLIGLWFSLRTHATQIWQNPQQLLQPMELPSHSRMSFYNKIIQNTHLPSANLGSLNRKTSTANVNPTSGGQTPVPREGSASSANTAALPPSAARSQTSPMLPRRVSYAVANQPAFLPVMESVDHVVKNTDLGNIKLSEPMTTDEFTRAVAVATVSALRHQQTQAHSPARLRPGAEHEGGGHGGHDAPSWSRTTSASVLLGCTFLYAIIAELLVDVVDVVLKGSGIDEKFLGITLFALVPNTTEFMNAISFALNGNIALSMEIGSAYALQVCLLQIPAMVAFSAWYAPDSVGQVAKTFTLIFPRWDVIALILSMFLMTYTYIEAKSNYHRGSILILSYLVLAAGFYFAPPSSPDIDRMSTDVVPPALQQFPALSFFQTIRWYLSSVF